MDENKVQIKKEVKNGCSREEFSHRENQKLYG